MDCDINLQILEHQTLSDTGHFSAPLYPSQQPPLKSLSVQKLSEHQATLKRAWYVTCHLAVSFPGSPGYTKLPSQTPIWDFTMGG